MSATTLSHLLAGRRPLPLRVALRIAVDLCSALHALHVAKSESGEALGLVHREVSPENVILGADGRARITSCPPAGSGPRRGKVGYAAPEVLRTGVASASSDMFAFGVVVWEMLAGRRLFEGDAGVVSIDRGRSRQAPRLAAVVGGVPALLDVVIAKALAEAGVDRFGSMQSLGVALEGAAHGLVASREEVAALLASAKRAPVIRLRPAAPAAPLAQAPRIVRVAGGAR